MNVHFKSFMILVFGIVIVSTAGPVIKGITLYPLFVAFFRVLLGFTGFLLLYLKKKSKMHKKGYDSISLPEKILFMSGGIFLALHFYFWISAFYKTTVAGGVIPLMIQPVLVTVMGRLIYKEKFRISFILPLLIIFTGVITMTLGDHSLGGQMSNGDMYSIVGTVMVSFYLLIAKKAVKKIGAIKYNVQSYFIASLILLAVIIFSGEELIIGSYLDLIYVLWLGYGCSFMGYLFINKSLNHFTVSEVSIALIGEPILSILWAFLIIKEIPNEFQLAGFVFGIAGMLIYFNIMKKEYIMGYNDKKL